MTDEPKLKARYLECTAYGFSSKEEAEQYFAHNQFIEKDQEWIATLGPVYKGSSELWGVSWSWKRKEDEKA